MLVLSRKRGQRVVIGGGITVTVIEARSDRVKLGFSAPNEVPIHREEVYTEIGLCAVPAGRRSPRNATEGVPYRGQFPDTLSQKQ